MNRRTFIGAAVTASVAGCIGGNNDNDNESATPEPTVKEAKNVTKEAEEVQELAYRFHKKAKGTLDEPRVFIKKNGEIVIEYQSSAQSEGTLETQMYNIVDLFVEQIERGEEVTTFTVVSDKVQVIAPEPSVKAYYNGELEKDAFFKTIEVMPVERKD